MRMTFGELVQQATDICIDDQSVTYTGMTDSLTFIKREINNTISDIFALMKEYRLQPAPKVIQTSSGQIYYTYPSGLMTPESFTVDIGTMTPDLVIIQAQEDWNRLQRLPVTSGFPTSVFPRRDDFGIYPTPSQTFDISITGMYQPARLFATDYTAGVVTVTSASTTLTVNGGTFSEDMVGRWFCLTDPTSGVPTGQWYRVAGYTSTSVLTLSRAYTEASGAGKTYIIGESPEIPEELHQYIPYRAGSIYWNVRRMDSGRAKELDNFFFTGDINNPNRQGRITGGIMASMYDMKNKGRGNSNLVETAGGSYGNLTDTIWGTTLHDST